MTDHPDPLLTAFAAVLRHHRRAAGFTQEGLAHEVGLSPRYISLLETCRHQPTLGTMADIADVLGVPLAQMIAEAEAVVEGDQVAAGDATGRVAKD